MKRLLCASLSCLTITLVAGPQVVINNKTANAAEFSLTTIGGGGSVSRVPVAANQRLSYDAGRSTLSSMTIVYYYDPHNLAVTKTYTFLIPESRGGEGWSWTYTIENGFIQGEASSKKQSFPVYIETINW